MPLNNFPLPRPISNNAPNIITKLFVYSNLYILITIIFSTLFLFVKKISIRRLSLHYNCDNDTLIFDTLHHVILFIQYDDIISLNHRRRYQFIKIYEKNKQVELLSQNIKQTRITHLNVVWVVAIITDMTCRINL